MTDGGSMTARPDDAGLVERARDGCNEALTELFHRYADMVFGVAFQINRSSDDAADVVQDVFIGLPEALRNYSEQGNLTGWLKRVAALTALLTERRRKRMNEVYGNAAVRTPNQSRPADVVDRIALNAAMDELPEDLRHVFVLKEIEGYSHAEIADLLGISPGASQMRLHRARGTLMALLEGG